MAVAQQVDDFISETDYLAGEKISEIKYEYIDGQVYAMAGASKNHSLISNNIARELANRLKQKKSSCKTLSSDIKVKIAEPTTRFYYPDVLIECADSGDDYYSDHPILIVEVLSKSTRKMDRTIKLQDYIGIVSLQEYVLIEQDFCEIQVMRRHQPWQPDSYYLGDEIHFSSLNISVSVADIYYQVNNPDVLSAQADQSL